MSIRLDSEKCWVSNPQHLKIQRYLSDTRTYFREGSWIRNHFIGFFPDIKIDPENGLYYDLTTLSPACTAEKGECLTGTKLPQSVVDQFQSTLNQFRSGLKNRTLSFNEEVASNEFTLPDPDLHPELYWLIRSGDEHRLVILWGLCSEQQYANVILEEVAKRLSEKHVGKIVLKNRSELTSVLKTETIPPVVSPVGTEPAPTVFPAPVEVKKQAPVPTPVKVKAPPPTPIEKPKMVDRGSSGIEKPKKEKAQKPPKLKVAAAVQKKAPAKSRKPFAERMSPKTRTLLVRSLTACATIIALVYATAGLSSFYLGPDIRISPNLVAVKGISFTVPQNHEAILPDGTKVTSGDKDHFVSLSGFPKPGQYRIALQQSGSNKLLESIEFEYQGLRKDFSQGPVATLLPSAFILEPHQTFEAYVGASFHKTPLSPLQLQISWGEEPAVFETINNPQAPLTHQYAQPGVYNVILVAKDSSGRWDYDRVDLNVVEPDISGELPSVNIPPVVDAEIVSIKSIEGAQEVTLDISGSYDPDGMVKTLEINWDDGAKPQSVTYPVAYVSRRYKGVRRADISIIATDNNGLENVKPSRLLVDFQSRLLSDPEQYAPPSEANRFSRILIPEYQPMELRLVRKEYAQVYRNKQHLYFEIQNPTGLSQCPLIDVQWTLHGPASVSTMVEGVTGIDAFLVDGIYTLSVTAKTPDGEQLTADHRIAVSVAKEISPLSKTAQWMARRFLPQSMSAKL